MCLYFEGHHRFYLICTYVAGILYMYVLLALLTYMYYVVSKYTIQKITLRFIILMMH